jgi:hypothetical protein
MITMSYDSDDDYNYTPTYYDKKRAPLRKKEKELEALIVFTEAGVSSLSKIKAPRRNPAKRHKLARLKKNSTERLEELKRLLDDVYDQMNKWYDHDYVDSAWSARAERDDHYYPEW